MINIQKFSQITINMEEKKHHGSYQTPGMLELFPTLIDEIRFYLYAHNIHRRPDEALAIYEKELLEAWKNGTYWSYMYELPERVRKTFSKNMRVPASEETIQMREERRKAVQYIRYINKKKRESEAIRILNNKAAKKFLKEQKIERAKEKVAIRLAMPKYVRNYERENDIKFKNELAKEGIIVSVEEAHDLRIKKAEIKRQLSFITRQAEIKIKKRLVKTQTDRLVEHIYNRPKGVYIMDIYTGEINEFDTIANIAENFDVSTVAIYKSNQKNALFLKKFVLKVKK